MLFAAGHAKNDIPSVLNTYQAQNEGMTIHYGRELGIDLKMLRAAGDRVAQAWRPPAPMCRATKRCYGGRSRRFGPGRQLQRGEGHADAVGRAWASAGPKPPIPASPSRWSPPPWSSGEAGIPRIVVFPYFLFTGILVQRIYDHTDAVAKFPISSSSRPAT